MIVVSSLPEARRCPSGEKAIELTQAVCLFRVRMSRPVAASQSLIILSSFKTKRCPSGEKAT